jgi:ribosomal protein S18 acetylase RimI-like enzyme
MNADVERARTFMRRTIAIAADESRAIEGGWQFMTPSLPRVWNLNHIGFGQPPPATRLLELIESHSAGLGFDHVVVEHDGSGAALEPELVGRGFRFDRELVMTLGQPPDPAAAERVIEPQEAEMLELIRLWVEEEWRPDPSETDQLIECARREGRARRERCFGVRDGDGRLLAMAKLRSDGVTAQVEDVYTIPDARRRGFARTLVTHATTTAVEAGHELVFIVADDNNWPKLLYERIGFQPAGRTWTFHRDRRKAA